MKKNAVIAFLIFFPLMIGAAGGQAQSGRDTNTDTIEGGQFVSPEMVDAYEYINDYEFPYDAEPGKDLSIFVRMEKSRALSIGDNFNVLIGLRVNEQNYFKRIEGNFIIFIHNPNILLQPEWKKAIDSALRKICGNRQSNAVLGIFNSAANEIINIPDENAIAGALSKIQNTRKVYANDAILDQSFRLMQAIRNNYNTRFLWITDSDLLRGNNAAREREYFDYLIKLQSQNNISFSYLGYGEVPRWAAMNQSLKNAGGNSYYVNNAAELEEKIRDDYDRFSYPTISDIKVNISPVSFITEARNDYRNEWYPVTFTPVAANYTHTKSNTIRNLDADEHRLFLYYFRIAAENAAASNQYYRDIVTGRNVPVGFVSVEYYSHNEGKTIYRVFPLQITFTDDYGSYSAGIDFTVRKFTVLQNTAFILKELSELVNKRQYYTAILLVDSQIKLLENFLKEKPDAEISGDIDVLMKNRDLLMEQARSLQYIR